MKHLSIIFILITLISCGTSKQEIESFEDFIDQFELVELPLDSLLERTHNNPLVNQRIDSSVVIRFIDNQYSYSSKVVNGYGYGVRLPKDSFDYHTLFYLQVQDNTNTFVLSTFDDNGKMITKHPFSALTSDGRKLISSLDSSRLLTTRIFIAASQQDTTVYTYRLNTNGNIEPQDTTILKFKSE